MPMLIAKYFYSRGLNTPVNLLKILHGFLNKSVTKTLDGRQ